MMTGHAVEEDRLAARVGEQVGCFGHLLESRPRPAHRHDDPVDARLLHHARLGDIFRIVGIDRREGDDRFDLLPRDQPAERPGLLPGPTHEPSGHDHAHPLLGPVVPGRNHRERCSRRGTRQKPDRNAAAHAQAAPFAWRIPADSAADCSQTAADDNPNLAGGSPGTPATFLQPPSRSDASIGQHPSHVAKLQTSLDSDTTDAKNHHAGRGKMGYPWRDGGGPGSASERTGRVLSATHRHCGQRPQNRGAAGTALHRMVSRYI